MEVVKLAQKPAIGVKHEATIREVVGTMVSQRIGAVLILEDDRAAGIFSERDVMSRVLLSDLDPDTTTVAHVMTTPVLTIRAETDSSEAIALMLDKHIRHLPVVDAEGRVLGMLSIRHLMADKIDELKDEVNALDAYMSYDGATG